MLWTALHPARECHGCGAVKAPTIQRSEPRTSITPTRLCTVAPHTIAPTNWAERTTASALFSRHHDMTDSRVIGRALRASLRRVLWHVFARTKRALWGYARHFSELLPFLVERERSPRPLAVYVLPVRSAASPANEFLTHVRAIVLAIDPNTDAPPDPALVRDLLGLTLGEARVASLVGSGLPPREAAEKLGISEETTRTTLKRVFSKTGVSRQSELTALLSRLALR